MNKTVLAAVVGLMFSTAMATMSQETPKAEVFAGYAYAGSGSNGFDTSIVGNINTWFGVGTDINGQYTRLDENGTRESINSHSFLFGPRFSLRKNKRLTPFVQTMFGISRIHTQ